MTQQSEDDNIVRFPIERTLETDLSKFGHHHEELEPSLTPDDSRTTAEPVAEQSSITRTLNAGMITVVGLAGIANGWTMTAIIQGEAKEAFLDPTPAKISAAGIS